MLTTAAYTPYLQQRVKSCQSLLQKRANCYLSTRHFLNSNVIFSPTFRMKSLVKPIPRPLSLYYSFHSFTTQTQISIPPNLIDDFTNFCYKKDLPRAMEALDSLEKHGVRANSVTYSELIKCCVANGAIEQGKRVHEHVYSNGYKPKTFLNNFLLNMYIKFDLLDEALKLFDEMCERNVVSWTTIISAYCKCKLNVEALKCLVRMQREGVQPNMFTLSTILRACDCLGTLRQLHCSIVKYGLDSDIFVRSALIDIYSKWGELDNGFRVFDEMPTGDLVVWNSIIGGFAQNGHGDKALDLFISMKRLGFQANQASLTSVFRACTGLALLELGRQVHAHVIKTQMDLILNNAILDMYCKCGSLEDARSAFKWMSEKDVISWSTMISGLAQNGSSIEALKLFESMKASGTKPNYITIVGVLFACSHAGLVDDGWAYFRSMKRDYGMDPRREHYGCMVDLLGRAGKFSEAIQFIHEMKCEPDAVIWRTLLGACKVYKNVGLATYVAKKIIKLEPQHEGTYILLSNIYADAERWEDVEDVRKNFTGKGLKKEPGCSWIEVNKQVHAFIFRDEAHPQIEFIYRELNHLIERIRRVGYSPDMTFVMHDLEGEQKEDSLRYHSEKLAIVYGLMSLPKEKPVRIIKNLRICGDCHTFAKLVSKTEDKYILIRDPVRYHHFRDGTCSCGDYW